MPRSMIATTLGLATQTQHPLMPGLRQSNSADAESISPKIGPEISRFFPNRVGTAAAQPTASRDEADPLNLSEFPALPTVYATGSDATSSGQRNGASVSCNLLTSSSDILPTNSGTLSLKSGSVARPSVAGLSNFEFSGTENVFPPTGLPIRAVPRSDSVFPSDGLPNRAVYGSDYVIPAAGLHSSLHKLGPDGTNLIAIASTSVADLPGVDFSGTELPRKTLSRCPMGTQQPAGAVHNANIDPQQAAHVVRNGNKELEVHGDGALQQNKSFAHALNPSTAAPVRKGEFLLVNIDDLIHRQGVWDLQH